MMVNNLILILLLPAPYLCNQIKKEEMSRACGTQWEEDKFLGNFDGKT
jgi:hypothetical protein